MSTHEILLSETKREKSVAKFCMNHTREVLEEAHFRPVYEISIVGAYGISFVGHLQLGRVNSKWPHRKKVRGQ